MHIQTMELTNCATILLGTECKTQYITTVFQTPLPAEWTSCYMFLYLLLLFSVLFPAYVSDLLTVHTPSRQPCSAADTWILSTAKLKLKPLANALSLTVSQCNKIISLLTSIVFAHVFKTALKTHLYKQYYSN